MKRLLNLTVVAVLTATAVGCSSCGHERTALFGRRGNCNTCGQPACNTGCNTCNTGYAAAGYAPSYSSGGCDSCGTGGTIISGPMMSPTYTTPTYTTPATPSPTPATTVTPGPDPAMTPTSTPRR